MREIAQIEVIMILVLVTSLLLSVLAFLEWNPKRLIHLFSLQPPLTCPTCVSPPSALLEKTEGFASFSAYRIHLSETHRCYIELHRLAYVCFHDLAFNQRPSSDRLQERSDRGKIWIKIYRIAPTTTQYCPLV